MSKIVELKNINKPHTVFVTEDRKRQTYVRFDEEEFYVSSFFGDVLTKCSGLDSIRLEEEYQRFISSSDSPYLTKVSIDIKNCYNPNYGDDRICKCGHTYDRHFDSYEDMLNVGCKYCDCFNFEEKI